MDPHFRAFSFVDRLEARSAGSAVRGRYTLSSAAGRFPISLVAEAVGQLAAWAAMAESDFRRRPVAGLAGAIEVFSAPSAGDTLELEAELESVDEDAIAYGGAASVEGRTLLRLHHCVGPMVALDEFDDPALVRKRFRALCDGSVDPGGFGGVPAPDLRDVSREGTTTLSAVLQVPETAPFFGDHFPRRAVYPGTLLMDANLSLALQLTGQVAPGETARWRLSEISDVKLRAFIAPGTEVQVGVRIRDQDEQTLWLAVENRVASRPVGGARVTLVRGAPS